MGSENLLLATRLVGIFGLGLIRMIPIFFKQYMQSIYRTFCL